MKVTYESVQATTWLGAPSRPERQDAGDLVFILKTAHDYDENDCAEQRHKLCIKYGSFRF